MICINMHKLSCLTKNYTLLPMFLRSFVQLLDGISDNGDTNLRIKLHIYFSKTVHE
jgi:hypothetical protein